MKKTRLLVVAVALFLLSGFISGSYAYMYEDSYSFAKDLTLGARAGALINQCDKNYIFGMPARGLADISIKGKDGWFMEVMLDKKLSDYFLIGLESGVLKYDFDMTVNPVTVSNISGDMGSFTVIPLIAHLRAQYPIEQYTEYSDMYYKFAPYVSVGIGGMFVDFEQAPYVTSTNSYFTTDSSALTGKYGLGFDFFFTEHLAINVEGSYLGYDVKTNLSNDGITDDEEVENNSWVVGGGVKYAF
ncbi:MAG: outer membrane beta-barrel protein [Candidatus Omnitrophota bacterium]